MAIKRHANARNLLLACLIIIMMTSAGCQRKASSTVSADEVKKLSNVVEKLSDKAIQAWNSHDLDQVHQVYTEDLVNYDSNVQCNGVQCILDSADWIFTNAPQFGVQGVDNYISGEDGFIQMNLLNFSAIPENPIIHAYVWVTPKDGKSSFWRPFFHLTSSPPGKCLLIRRS